MTDDLLTLAQRVLSGSPMPIERRLAQAVIDQRDEARDCAAVNKVLMGRLSLTEQAVIDLTAQLERYPWSAIQSLRTRAEAAERERDEARDQFDRHVIWTDHTGRAND